jgi:DNA-binding NarL/FixJ family response regulator
MARVLVREDSQMASLLTRRELEIIRMMAEGNTNARIAERLVISDGTVKTHVKHILRKLRAENRVEAVSKFLRMTGERPSSDG